MDRGCHEPELQREFVQDRRNLCIEAEHQANPLVLHVACIHHITEKIQNRCIQSLHVSRPTTKSREPLLGLKHGELLKALLVFVLCWVPLLEIFDVGRHILQILEWRFCQNVVHDEAKDAAI